MNISSLKLFNSKGYSIPVKFNHRITFTVNGRSEMNLGWKENPEGYIDIDNAGGITSMGLTSPGRSFAVDSYSSLSLDEYSKMLTDYFITNLKVSLADNNFYFIELDKSDFGFTLAEETQSYSDSSSEEIHYFKLGGIELKGDTGILISKYANIANLYPSTTFHASLYTEPVATELVSTESIYVLERTETADGSVNFIRPQSLTEGVRFEFPEADTSTFFIKDASEYFDEDGEGQDFSSLDHSKIYWSTYKTFVLPEDYSSDGSYIADKREPLMLQIGFKTEEEGAYEDHLVMNVVNLTDASTYVPVPVGVVSVKSESVGEDERYRTLFTNFGIPDPKYYPHIFKETDIQEDGTDWKFINKKSKQLFLTYDKIFPYAGSYKALVNAVRYLGYDDIYFKEWYQFFDTSTNQKVAFQKMDVQTGETLKQKLARYGVSLEEFSKWKKMNKLSMIYKINQETDTVEAIKGKYRYIDSKGNTAYYDVKNFETLDTKNDYTYSDTEVLTKLQALKEWLEKYIIGLNCRIADVTGEGIYVEKENESAYTTGQITFSDIKEKPVSPMVVYEDSSLQIEDSSAVIALTLKEFNDNLTFNDLKDFVAFDFDKAVQSPDSSMSFISAPNFRAKYGVDGILDSPDNDLVPYSADADVPTEYNDFRYELVLDSSCGCINRNISSPILVKDNKISVLSDIQDAEFLDGSADLPFIRIAKGEIRQSFGKWKNNLLFNVEYAQGIAGWKYQIEGVSSKEKIESEDLITLKPSEGATFKYTDKNKYHVPLFMFSNYRVSGAENGTEFFKKDKTYVLMINEGFIETKEFSATDYTNCNARIEFDDVSKGEQQIYMRYFYTTTRIPTFTLGSDENKQEYLKEVNEAKDGIASAVNEMNKEAGIKGFQEREELEKQHSLKIGTINSTIQDYQDKIVDISTNEIPNADSSVEAQMLQSTIEQYKKYIHALELTIGYENNDYAVETVNITDEYDTRFTLARSNLMKKLHQILGELKVKFYQVNKIFPINVNHIGDYSVSAIVWDNYNIPFANKNENTVQVYGVAPDVNIIREYSDFENPDSSNILEEGSRIFSQFITDCTKPKFWPDYRETITKATGDNWFNYDAISYIMDAPKEDEYLKLNNTTELIEKIEDHPDSSSNPDSSDNTDDPARKKGYLTAVACDENYENQNLFFTDASIMLYFVDPQLHGMPADEDNIAGPFRVLDFQAISILDSSEENNNWLKLHYNNANSEFYELDDDVLKMFNSEQGTYECFAANVSRFQVTFDDISIDFKNGYSDIAVHVKSKSNIWHENQLVKLEYYKRIDLHETDDNSSTGNEMYYKEYVSGTTFRISSVVSRTDSVQVYRLKGFVNRNLLTRDIYKNGWYANYNDDCSIYCDITADHSQFVSYIVKESEDADETEGGLGSKAYIYDTWNAKSYIDDTFSFFTFDFNPNNALKEWDYNNINTSVKHYYANDFDECLQNEGVLVISNDKANSFCDWSFDDDPSALNYMSHWFIRNNESDQKDNETLLYSVINESVPVKLTHEGVYHFQLEAIDCFGNCLTNDFGFWLRIKDSSIENEYSSKFVNVIKGKDSSYYE